ncbi:MAG: hypothetical protein JWL76_368 [Thermoleophilia bacterium]|nr:hypothetical protein [Thermoleophilia bacterium]
MKHNPRGTDLRHRVAPRLTYANVMATIAVALSLGGVSYAAVALPRNSVGAAQLQTNSVTTTKVANGSLTLRDLAAPTRRALTGTSGPAGAVGSAGPTGAPGARGPSTIHTSATSAPSTMTLPAGSHLVFGFARSSTPGTSCTLTIGSDTDTAGLPQGGAMTLMLAVQLTSATPATLSCSGTVTYGSRLAAVQADALSIS